MLKEHDVAFNYREYRDDPLDADEIRTLLRQLGMGVREVLRTRDRVAKELALTGDETDDELIELMAEHPTLLQRPVGVIDGRAVLGRPPENLLALVS